LCLPLLGEDYNGSYPYLVLLKKEFLLKDKNLKIFAGPATVGGIKPGCFRIGNTGGAMDNIVSSKLYRPGSVAYVSR
jgi:succinyl-CoA synthetase alpha subunit